MHRDGPLKNIFKEDNWGDVGKASTFMYTRKADESFDPKEYEKLKEKARETPAVNESVKKEESPQSAQASSPKEDSVSKEAVMKLKAEKDQEVAMIVQKINDLIARQNKMETALDEANNKVKELSNQITLYLKKPEPSTQKIEKREPVDVPIDRNNVAPSDVTIEKMFNFSNKKF